MSKKLRIMLIAEACNPQWASVPLVGYQLATSISKQLEVEATVVTQIRNAKAIAGSRLPNFAKIHFIDNEWIAAPIYRLGRLLRGGDSLGYTTSTAVQWVSYMSFEKQIYQTFKKELDNGYFDIIHRLTPLTPTYGSPLASLTTTPMMLGPLNGGLPWPPQYRFLSWKEREFLSSVRKFYKCLPYYRSTYRSVRAVISGSHHTASELPAWFAGQKFYLPENGIDPERFPLAEDWTAPKGAFQFVSVARFVPYKALDMIVEAMARSETLRQCRLNLVGDGPAKVQILEAVRRSNLQEQVKFSGWLEQRELGKLLRESQAFVFPSLREFGGAVVLEAMASGLPCIVANYGGPAELVSSAGIRLQLGPRNDLIESIKKAMELICRDHGLAKEYAQKGIKRISQEFTWDQKASRIVQFYRKIL